MHFRCYCNQYAVKACEVIHTTSKPSRAFESVTVQFQFFCSVLIAVSGETLRTVKIILRYHKITRDPVKYKMSVAGGMK